MNRKFPMRAVLLATIVAFGAGSFAASFAPTDGSSSMGAVKAVRRKPVAAGLSAIAPLAICGKWTRMAQNPIELEGTYPLPEAQLDRFFFKLMVAPPSPVELREILKRTTGAETGDAGKVLPDDGGKLIGQMQQLLRQVLIAPPIEDYVVRIVHATQPNLLNGNGATSPVKQYLRFGSSPRGAQAVILGAKGNALADGRIHVSYEDVAKVIYPALRHRIILNFQAEAENVSTDEILAEVVKQVPRA